MWYKFIKDNEDAVKVSYAYSYESKELSGILCFDKVTEEITFPKLAIGDDGTQVNRFGGAFRRKVLEEKYPEQIFLAFG